MTIEPPSEPPVITDFEDNTLQEPFESMKADLGETYFDDRFEHVGFESLERRVDHISAAVMCRILDLFGYAAGNNIERIDMRGQVVRPQVAYCLAAMRKLADIDQRGLEYVFEFRDAALNDGFSPFDKTSKTEGFAPDEVRLTEVCDKLNAMEVGVARLASSLGIRRIEDIRHPAVAEVRAQMSGGRAH